VVVFRPRCHSIRVAGFAYAKALRAHQFVILGGIVKSVTG
jgi:hypothetical protein